MKTLMTRACALALAGAALSVAPASAQNSGDFAGLYTFQTTNYRSGGEVGVLSGVARSTPLGGGWYDINLYAIEYIQTASGESRNTAAQDCEGRREGPVITITCTVVNSDAAGYQPDNFTLRQHNSWQWDGNFTSVGGSSVTFVHYED